LIRKTEKFVLKSLNFLNNPYITTLFLTETELMPIYEYKCAACGHRMEKLQRLSDDPLKDCPACGRPELSKLVSAAAFKLKGTVIS